MYKAQWQDSEHLQLKRGALGSIPGDCLGYFYLASCAHEQKVVGTVDGRGYDAWPTTTTTTKKTKFGRRFVDRVQANDLKHIQASVSLISTA